MLRILHTADVQIDATLPELGRHARARRNDLLHTFEHLVALAIRENVHLFLVSGNLFATPRPDEAAAQRVATGLRRLTARGILPVLLPGDCDGMLSPDSIYLRDTFRNLLILDGRTPASPVTIRVAGRTLHLYGFCQRNQQPLPPEDIRIDEEGAHVALMCYSSAVHMEPTFLERISRWGMDYLACAPSPHWQTIEVADTIFGCAPGAPEGYAFSHTGPRFAALVQLDGEQLHLERRQVQRRTVEVQELDLGAYGDSGELASAITGQARNDLLRRVVLTGSPRFAVDAGLLQRVCAADFFHLDVQDISDVLAGDVACMLREDATILGEFMRSSARMATELSHAEGALVREAVRAVVATRAQPPAEVSDETD